MRSAGEADADGLVLQDPHAFALAAERHAGGRRLERRRQEEEDRKINSPHPPLPSVAVGLTSAPA